jgi:F-type H+-transporting ATPase subunit epsilon
MSMHLNIITPRKMVFQEEIEALTAPGSEGELTVLPKHAPLFTMLDEGVVWIQTTDGEKFYSIGGGYLETDGFTLNLLVSRAYGQDEIDIEQVKQAKLAAEKLLETAVHEQEREQILRELRRSIIDLKVIHKMSNMR